MLMTRLLTRSAILMAVLSAMTAASVWAADNSAASAEKEKELLAVLRSEASAAEKAITCKLLAIHGSSESAAELAKLLPNEQLSSWSRIALEAIPGDAADDALIAATESLEGRLLVGTINSIGVRRTAKAAERLTTLLHNPDAEVASAAAVALGRIGSDAIGKSLQKELATSPNSIRSAVAEGCVLCAERHLAEGRAAESIALYDAIRAADVPRQRMLEATRGAILARGQQGIPLLLEQLRSPDKSLMNIALSTAREFPGKDIDQSLASELATAAPERAALIVVAMADRSDTVVLSAVLKAAASGPKVVRLAALDALGRVGNTSCLSVLLASALEVDEDLEQRTKTALANRSEKGTVILPVSEISLAATKSLAELRSESIDKEIVTRLAKAEGKIYPLLIELVGKRRIAAAMPALFKAMDHSDKTIRVVALTSLGETVPADKLSVLIKEVVTPKHADDAAIAQQALKTASIRMPDREACATELAAALDRASVPTKIVLLQVIGAVGGTKALNAIGTASKNPNPELQDAGTKLLGEWSTIDVAPVLLDLSKSAPDEKFQVRAMRGYIRVVRQFTMSEPERNEMCKTALAASRQTAEKKLVIEVLKRYPTIETLKLALSAAKTPELKDDANQAALSIIQKIGSKSAEARELLASVEIPKVKLEIVKAEYGAGANQKDVTDIIKKQATDSPVITLTSPSYNECFGGDPAPSTVKMLRIRYTMNDKAGDVSFAEDALIILPPPK